jgi:hypothetical protein
VNGNDMALLVQQRVIGGLDEVVANDDRNGISRTTKLLVLAFVENAGECRFPEIKRWLLRGVIT